MRAGNSSSLANSFEAAAPPARPPRRTKLAPVLHPATLAFDAADLESDFLRHVRRNNAALVRLGLGMTLLVLLMFTALYISVLPRQHGLTWALHSGGVLSTVFLIAISFTRVFEAEREKFLLPFCLLLGCGLTALMSTLPAEDMNRYHSAYGLLILATYTIYGLRFVNAALVSAALFGMYVSASLSVQPVAAVADNAVFLFATFVVATLGGYAYERQRRVAHFRLREIEREHARSEHSALHDGLTGLPNRRLFMERLNHAMARDKRNHTFAALLFIDLDNFKPVNDTHGHLFGDHVLKAVGQRLRGIVRDTDTVARLGGDEFVVLLEDLGEPSCAEMLMQRAQEAFEKPFELDDKSVLLGVSIGCAIDLLDAKTPRDLLHAADRGMYRMKQARAKN